MLDAAAADYDQLTWSGEGTNLAVLRGDKARGKLQKDNVLLAWTQRRHGRTSRRSHDRSREGRVLSCRHGDQRVQRRCAGAPTARGCCSASRRRSRRRRRRPNRRPTSTSGTGRTTEPQSVQIIRVNQDRRATFAAVVDLASGSIRQIADDDMRTITANDDLTWAIGRVDMPYRGQIAWGGSKADIYRVNLTTGERTLDRAGPVADDGLLARRQVVPVSAEGPRLLVRAWRPAKKTAIDGGKSFVDAEDDHDYEKPVYGVAGFTADGKSALLYDRYDLWTLPLAGGQPVNLTKGDGAKQEIAAIATRRLVRRRPWRARRRRRQRSRASISRSRSRSPRTASARRSAATSSSRPGRRRRRSSGRTRRSARRSSRKNADRMIFTQQTFTEYPNYWVSDKRFGCAAPGHGRGSGAASRSSRGARRSSSTTRTARASGCRRR